MTDGFDLMSAYAELNLGRKSRLRDYLQGVKDGYTKEVEDKGKSGIEEYTNGLMVGMGITEENEFTAEVDRIESQIYPLSLKDLVRNLDLNKFTGLDTILGGK